MTCSNPGLRCSNPPPCAYSVTPASTAGRSVAFTHWPGTLSARGRGGVRSAPAGSGGGPAVMATITARTADMSPGPVIRLTVSRSRSEGGGTLITGASLDDRPARENVRVEGGRRVEGRTDPGEQRARKRHQPRKRARSSLIERIRHRWPRLLVRRGPRVTAAGAASRRMSSPDGPCFHGARWLRPGHHCQEESRSLCRGIASLPDLAG